MVLLCSVVELVRSLSVLVVCLLYSYESYIEPKECHRLSFTRVSVALPGSSCVPMDTGKVTLNFPTLSTTRSGNRTRRRRRKEVSYISPSPFSYALPLSLSLFPSLFSSLPSICLNSNPNLPPSLPLPLPRYVTAQWRWCSVWLFPHPPLPHLQWLQGPHSRWQTPPPPLWV